ncbi:hypothetical protein [Paenibacillus thermotolerans]|uniref:hypothetical protein n=1 Tax=Paenibacillus thermotolerans TaxID=3027807 RepID=UPI002368D791|nr:MULTISPECIES: hypothetical protein [unclassified Paenibacillus]
MEQSEAGGELQWDSVVIFLAAWLAVFGFYSMRKSLTIIENAFIFLTVLILSINFSWIVIEELHRVEESRRGIDYTALLISRSILIPMLLVIALNAIYLAKKNGGAWLAALAAVVLIAGVNVLGLLLGIMKYVRWNLLYDIVYAAAMLGAAYGLHKLYRRSMRGEDAL